MCWCRTDALVKSLGFGNSRVMSLDALFRLKPTAINAVCPDWRASCVSLGPWGFRSAFCVASLNQNVKTCFFFFWVVAGTTVPGGCLPGWMGGTGCQPRGSYVWNRAPQKTATEIKLEDCPGGQILPFRWCHAKWIRRCGFSGPMGSLLLRHRWRRIFIKIK